MEDWAEIRRLHRAEGMPIKAIVRATGVSRNAVQPTSFQGLKENGMMGFATSSVGWYLMRAASQEVATYDEAEGEPFPIAC